MKSTPIPAPKAKRPKARVAAEHVSSCALHPVNARGPKQWPENFHVVAIIPATRKQAQQIVRWANLSRAEKIRRMMLTQLPYCGAITMLLSEGQAIAILTLIEGPAP